MRDIRELYRARFDPKELEAKNKIWKILCDDFFQRYIDKEDIVLDIGAGYCEFINNIKCRAKYAVDLNEDTQRFANADVTAYNISSTNLSVFEDNYIDVVFISNFLEHLKDKDEVILTLAEVNRVLKDDGKVLILQPNIKYLYKDYWDFLIIEYL
ncbi:MAG: methyltransferase domain-containing protein [bacterium]